ncbi:MerR family transcriptional regulator [Streptomyces sp. TRM66268-LWL]|uniref:MerR family transcriptional regulator n=1 Tax=Streptomyces polyasparticus TaxID=2767826 RepID=A0ABR7S9F8_9ACTN|nr:MerR family transcriptional regulator [Streptomyces polyasparticus]MBC9712116.1 MerR family transcriptional regulator [Streptomyces polyasparticus]
MKIGQLSAETGVSIRLLRYYEEQGLLTSTRTPGGHRVYGADAPATVRRIRRFLDAGLSTRIIAEIIECVCGSEQEIEPCLSPLVLAELSRVDQELERLALTRESLAELVAAARG